MIHPLPSPNPPLVRTASARIPTPYGVFQLSHYSDARDGKEHLALTLGELAGRHDVLVRVHSECMTGDTFGSLRCDCGEQLHRAMQRIAELGQGAIVYLRQEGRGIGLAEKLRAYNLQDQGFDTVEANLMLGHQADEREYWAAADILRDLGVQSVRLLTNNPAKIEELRTYGVQITERMPLPSSIHADNAAYLQTKVARMRHLMSLPPTPTALPPLAPELRERVEQLRNRSLQSPLPSVTRPSVTLAYAQSLDGSLAAVAGQPLALSGQQSLTLTHALRAAHDAILIGVGTLLADDPLLTVRLAPGPHPQPVVLDSTLRTPLNARLLAHPRGLWICTTDHSSPARRQELAEQGAQILLLPATPQGQVNLTAALATLHLRGIHSVMVEGGPTVLASFVQEQLANDAVITLVPRLVGGLHLFQTTANSLPHLTQVAYTQAGADLIVWGVPAWEAA